MNSRNPYEAPQADISLPPLGEPAIEQVAKAQKLIIYAILAYFAAVAAQALIGAVGVLVLLLAALMGLLGTWRLCAGLGYSTVVKVLLLVLMFVPLVSLLVLVVLNGKATRRLRDAGYHVGLLGATR